MYDQQNDDIEQPTSQEQYERLNNIVRKLRRKHKNSLPNACCCCLDTRLGSRLACFIWAGLSLYFACLAFMNKSPFYSYFSQIPLLIFGVLNLFFFFVNIAGIIIITWKAAPFLLGRLSQVIWGFVIAILLDMFVNYVVFLAKPTDFRDWCISLSQASVQQAFNQVNQNSTVIIPFNRIDDFYNCDRLYQDELTWTLLSLVAMVLVYVHWAMVITSWERWYVIQPPRMALHNDINVDNMPPSDKPFQQTGATMEQDPNHDQHIPYTNEAAQPNPMPYFPSSSSPSNQQMPTADQAQNQPYYHMNPPASEMYSSQHPSSYIPPQESQNQSDFDPQYYQQQQHQHQQQDPYSLQTNDPYAAQHQQYYQQQQQQQQQQQPYYPEHQYGGSGEDNRYYRY
ncbi:unnamed protein product [Absidia cylindrospora]